MEDFAGFAKGSVLRNQRPRQQLKTLTPKPNIAQNVVHVWCSGMDDMAHSMVAQNFLIVKEPALIKNLSKSLKRKSPNFQQIISLVSPPVYPVGYFSTID